jgi:hypothetical protein
MIGGMCGSCNNNKTANSGKPIVLGDSSTIVTERDSQYLKDFVADIKPAQQVEPKQDTVAINQPVTNAVQPEQAKPKEEELKTPAPTKTEEGLTIAFKEVTVFIPNITTKAHRQRRPNTNGASFELEEGELNRNQIRVTEGNVQKISQRYQSVVTARTSMGPLTLAAISKTTDWQPLSGKGNAYLINGLNAHDIKHHPAEIRTAAMKAVRGKRMSRGMKQRWEAAAQRIHPRDVSTSIRSVMWKIEGKDARGRNYQKQVRVDL